MPNEIRLDMGFEHDIMISYAWRDNQPPPMTTQEGWVSGFQEGLEYWLKQVMPRTPKVWRDKNRMPGNKIFAEELDAVVANCAILLAVLSEPYLASEWCARERENFIKAAKEQGGLEVNNDYRIFKINKLPVDRKALPGELNVVTGFDFYEMDPETRTPAPIDPSFGDKEKQRFIRKVYEVSVSIARLLKSIEAQGMAADKGESGGVSSQPNPEATNEPLSDTPGLTVFIPFTTRDLREVREDLVSELTRRNCRILPEENANDEDAEAFKQAVLADLAKADLCIHLIGTRYGTIMEGETRSVIELQNEWAAEESHKRGIKRLIWIPDNVGEVTGQQAAFVNCLRTDRQSLTGADLLEDSVENLKTIVLDMVKPKPKPAPVLQPTQAGVEELKLYIVHDESDRDAVRDLRRALKDKVVGGKPLRLILPVFDGDAASLREIHRQRLIECDAVLVYWGGGSQAWVEAGLSEVRKSPGFGRTRGFRAKHMVYLTGNKSSAKEDWWLDYKDGLLEADITTVEAYGGVPLEAIDPFINTIA